MNIKKLASIMGLGLGLAVAAGPAHSSVKWSFQDDDVDFLYRPGTGLIDPSTCAGAACDLTIGDVLISVLEFPTFTIGGNNAIPAGKEVTGIAAIQYNADIVHPVFGPSRAFGPYSGGLNAILALGDGADPVVPGGAAGEGAMAALFINDATSPAGEDRDLDLDKSSNLATNCTSLADCIDEGSKGSLLQVDGMYGRDGILGTADDDPDEFWVSSTGGTNIFAVHGLSEDIVVVTVNFGLSTIFNTVTPIFPQDASGNPSPACTPGGADLCVDVRGNGNVTGGNGLSNGAFAHSTTITASKFVPEPATLALFGAGLLGIGIRFPRRNKACAS